MISFLFAGPTKNIEMREVDTGHSGEWYSSANDVELGHSTI
jgi:hypothetical protein